MRYRLVVNPSVEKGLAKIPTGMARRIRDKIRGLAEDPHPPNCKKMKGGERSYRIRVGDYRIIYEIDDQKVIIHVITIGHRRDVYRRR